MAADKHNPEKTPPKGGARGAACKDRRPDWADGLRALYDSVVDEPLPDSFKDLLNRLDDPSANGSS